MATKFRSASIYIKGKRQKYKTDGSVEYTHNGEPITIEDGYENHSSAPITSQVQMNQAVPVGGTGGNLMNAFIEEEEVEVSISALDGQIHTIEPMTITNCSFNFDDKNQTQVFAITLMGGKPTLTG